MTNDATNTIDPGLLRQFAETHPLLNNELYKEVVLNILATTGFTISQRMTIEHFLCVAMSDDASNE